MQPNIAYKVTKDDKTKPKKAQRPPDHKLKQNAAYGVAVVPLERKMQQNIAYEAVKIAKGWQC